MGVGTELELHLVEVGGRVSGDEGGGAEGVGHAVLPWELVETADHVGH